ncbi:MAG: NAD-dependent epimerase/dehydratase family protein [Sphingobium sp.]
MSRYLVTGAAGFTGRYLTALLADAGHEVHGIVHGAPDARVAGIVAEHACDLADADAVRAVIADTRPDHVAHLAAIAFVAHGDIAEMYRTNIVGTRNLLDALATTAVGARTVLVASSANIYGNARAGILDESMTPAPANDYGVTKAATEQLCAIYGDRLPIIVTRPFNYTGRGQSAQFLIPKIVDHARRRAPVLELGNIDVARDFSDVRAVADAYQALLATPEAAGGTFNICSGRAVTLRDIIAMVESLSGHRFEVMVNPALVRANEVRSLAGNRARLESAIGSRAFPSLEETLQWMLADAD